MTEEEKKEFEEFLQWKAEKRKVELEQNAAKERIEPKENYSNEANFQSNVNLKKDFHTSGSDVNLKLLLIGSGIIVALILIVCVIANNNTRKVTEKVRQERIQDSINTIKKKAIALQQAKEKAVKDSIQRVERIQILKKSVKITTTKLSSPNSAGGCDATIYYKNISNKTIKYFDWTGYCINAVGDRVLCEIRRDEIYRGRDTGPVRPGKYSGGTWDCIIYNWSAKKIILTGVEIEYTDGSYLNISQNELKYIR